MMENRKLNLSEKEQRAFDLGRLELLLEQKGAALQMAQAEYNAVLDKHQQLAREIEAAQKADSPAPQNDVNAEVIKP